MNRLVSFLLLLAILGIIIGALNKGARAIGFFIALLAFVLLIGTPGSGNLNFFANLFNGGDTTGTQSFNANQPGAGQGGGGTQTFGTSPTTGTTGTTPQTTAPRSTGTAQTGVSQSTPRNLPAQAPAGAGTSAPTSRTLSPGTTTPTRTRVYDPTTGTFVDRTNAGSSTSGRARALW